MYFSLGFRSLSILLSVYIFIATLYDLSRIEAKRSRITPPPRLKAIVEKDDRIGRKNLEDFNSVVASNSHILPGKKFPNLSAEDMCKNSSLCLPALLNFETELRVLPRYNLSTCVVQKSMSTVMTGIFCYLFDEEAFSAAGRDILSDWKIMRRNEARSINSMRKHFGPHRNWTLTMVVRDPIDRFLSGFVDKCIRLPLPGSEHCNGCDKNMTCFLETELQRAQKQVENQKFFRTFEDRHFFPQNWRCELEKHLKEYRFIRYSSDPSETLLTDLIYIFRQLAIPEKSIDHIRRTLVADRTVHTTVTSKAREFLEKRLASSPYLMELLIRLFYHDFRLLDFPLPDGF